MGAWKSLYLLKETNLLENFLVQNYDMLIKVLEVVHRCGEDDENDNKVLSFLQKFTTLNYEERVKAVVNYQKDIYLALHFWWFEYGYIAENETNVHIQGFKGFLIIENLRRDKIYAQYPAIRFLFEPRFIPELGEELGEENLFVSWLTKDEVKQVTPIFPVVFSESDWQYDGFGLHHHIKALTEAQERGCGLIIYQDY